MLTHGPLERILSAEHTEEHSIGSTFDVLLTKLRAEHERVKQEKSLLLGIAQQSGVIHQSACQSPYEDLLRWLPPAQPRPPSCLHCDGDTKHDVETLCPALAVLPHKSDANHQHSQDLLRQIQTPPQEFRSGHGGSDCSPAAALASSSASCQDVQDKLTPAKLNNKTAQLQSAAHADSATGFPIGQASGYPQPSNTSTDLCPGATPNSGGVSLEDPWLPQATHQTQITTQPSRSVGIVFRMFDRSMHSSSSSRSTATVPGTRACKKNYKASRLSKVIKFASTTELDSPQNSRWDEFLEMLSLCSLITVASSSELVEATLQPFMNVVVLVDILMLGVNVDTKDWSGWRIINICFLIVFSLEILVMLKLVGRKYFRGPGRHWNLLDVLLVVISAVNVGISNFSAKHASTFGIIRILRLGRLVRLLRMLRSPYAKEFLELVGGMTGGTRTLMWSIALMILPVYVLSIVFVEIVGDSGNLGDLQKYFSSVPMSMYTLVRCMLGDCNDSRGKPLSLLLSDRCGWSMGLFYCIYMWIAIAGLFNLISAIFVQNALASSNLDETFQRRLRAREQAHVAKQLKEFLILCWSMANTENPSHVGQKKSFRGTGSIYKTILDTELSIDALEECKHLSISHEMYQALVRTEEGQRIFQNLGLSNDIEDMFDILDADGSGELSMHELVDGIQQLRGQPRRSDLVGLGYTLRALQSSNVNAHRDQSTLLASIKKSFDILNTKGSQRRPHHDTQSVDSVLGA